MGTKFFFSHRCVSCRTISLPSFNVLYCKLAKIALFIAELRRPKGPPSGAPYPYRKLKETHELIFSWLSWLAVLLMGAYARRRRWRRWRRSVARWRLSSRSWAPGWQGHEALVYRVLLWHWTFMLWSIDTCQNKASADQYHVTISQAQVYNSSRSCWPLTKCWFFDWITGSCQVNLLKTGQDCSEAS